MRYTIRIDLYIAAAIIVALFAVLKMLGAI